MPYHMDIYSIWTGRNFTIFSKQGFQPNFGTVNGEKLNDTILKVEMSIENMENKIFVLFGDVGPNTYLGKFGSNTQMSITKE